MPRSNIDNRLQQVSIGKTSIGVDFFLPLCRFPAFFYTGNLFNRFDMGLTEGVPRDSETRNNSAFRNAFLSLD